MRRIKVLHISQATGGVERHVISLVSRLDPSRFEVVGSCPTVDQIPGVSREKESFVEAFRRIGVRVVPIEMRRELHFPSDLKSFFKIYRLIRREKFDIVHTHSSKAGFLARVAARLAGVPVVIHTPNNFAFDRPQQDPSRILYRYFEKLAGLFCDCIIAVSRSEERLAWEVVPRGKVVRIENAIDLNEVTSRGDPAEKRKNLGLSPGQPIVSMVGRLAVQKSPNDFVLAAKEVLAQKKDVAFLIIGDGPLGEEVRNLMASLQLEKNVLLLGWREDVFDLMAASDLIALTSLWEGLPYTLLEAMALGKPIVATDATGSVDIVKDGENGVLVPRGDIRGIANAIVRLLSDPARAKAMGLAGRRYIEKEHITLQQQAARTQSLYLELLKRNAPKRVGEANGSFRV